MRPLIILWLLVIATSGAENTETTIQKMRLGPQGQEFQLTLRKEADGRFKITINLPQKTNGKWRYSDFGWQAFNSAGGKIPVTSRGKQDDRLFTAVTGHEHTCVAFFMLGTEAPARATLWLSGDLYEIVFDSASLRKD